MVNLGRDTQSGYSDQAACVLPLSGVDDEHRAGGYSNCNGFDLVQGQEVQAHSGGDSD